MLERDRTAGVTLGRLDPFDLTLARSTPTGPVPVSGTEFASLGLPKAKVVDAALRATWEQELAKLDLVSGMGEICRSISATVADPCDPTVYWWDGLRLERIRFTAVAGSETSLLAGPRRLREILAGLPDTNPQST